uniref:MARVEL domain-containing protein n=1 Tax=Globodera rostochiensis TaxID=31243 RepID=A0A914HCC9_GLORO
MIPIECNSSSSNNNPNIDVGIELEKATCCWGVFRTNAEQGALIVAFIGILFSLLGAFAFFMPFTDVYDPMMGVAGLLYVFPCLCVLLALRRRDPRLYLPYLIYGVIEMMFYLSVLFVSVLFMLNPPEDNVQQHLKDNPTKFTNADQARKDYRMSQGGEAAILLADVLVSLWFYYVIWTAYKVMRHRRSRGRVLLTEISTN